MAQFSVQVGQRFIEQKGFRIADNGPAHCDALALTPGKLTRHTVKEMCQPENFSRFFNPRHALCFGHVGEF